MKVFDSPRRFLTAGATSPDMVSIIYLPQVSGANISLNASSVGSFIEALFIRFAPRPALLLARISLNKTGMMIAASP